jgi:hypothetical protein
MSALPTYNEDMTLDACLETLEGMMLLNGITDGFTKFENGLMYYKGKSTLRYKSLLKDENFGTYRNSDKEWQSKKYLIEFENEFRANTTLFNSDKIEVGNEYEFVFERKLGKWNNIKKCFNEYTCITVLIPKKKKVNSRKKLAAV